MAAPRNPIRLWGAVLMPQTAKIMTSAITSRGQSSASLDFHSRLASTRDLKEYIVMQSKV